MWFLDLRQREFTQWIVVQFLTLHLVGWLSDRALEAPTEPADNPVEQTGVQKQSAELSVSRDGRRTVWENSCKIAVIKIFYDTDYPFLTNKCTVIVNDVLLSAHRLSVARWSCIFWSCIFHLVTFGPPFSVLHFPAFDIFLVLHFIVLHFQWI